MAGDVTPGMKIKTSGDVVIGGFVEGGYIESSGTITVRNGIIGRKSEQSDEYLCHLNAQGEIHASYAQYAKLEAGGDIQIQSQLSHSYSRSGQDIKVGDSGMRKGHLLGGISIANRLIMAPILGASAYNQTRLQILGGYFTTRSRSRPCASASRSAGISWTSCRICCSSCCSCQERSAIPRQCRRSN